MNKHRETAEYFLDLCSSLGRTRLRAMFGGHGLYSGEAMFGLEAYGELYLKTDEINRSEFESIGAKPFVYENKSGKKTVMSYYAPPPEFLEDREKLSRLLESSFSAAMRAFEKKRGAKKR